MRRKVKVVFDHLQQSVEERRHQVNDLIRAEEDAAMTSLTELEKTRASVTSYAGTIDHIMTSSPRRRPSANAEAADVTLEQPGVTERNDRQGQGCRRLVFWRPITGSPDVGSVRFR